jgi:hypothetical protein
MMPGINFHAARYQFSCCQVPIFLLPDLDFI